MKFGRVLVTTTLVAVLASSLFSGLLTSSPSPFKPPIAQAQTDPIVTACNAANDQGQFIGTSGAQFNGVTNGYEIRLTLEALTASALNPTAKLYKKKVADTAYKSLATISLAETPGSPIFGNDKWAGSYSDSFANILTDTGNYILLVKATFNGQAISKCYQKVVLSTGGGSGTGSSGSIYTKDVVQGWLGSVDLPGLKINIYETANTPPKVIIPKSKLGDRPPEDLTFKLVAHSGEGAFFIGNKDWMTFQGYVGSTKVDYFYFQISDDLDANFIYETDFDELVKGHDTPTGTELNRAYAGEGTILGNSIGDLFTYVMNVPMNDNDTVGGENCGNGSTPKLIKTVGPIGKGVSPEANISRTTEVGVDGLHARLLNQNCLNDAANSANGGSANGWLAYWGVKNVFSSNPGSTCGLNSLVSIFKDGVGVAVVKLFACVVQTIIDGVFAPLEKATQGAGKETGALECNLAGETNAQIPASCQEPGRDGPPNSSFYKAWRYSLGLINVLVILALLAIAFANILHLNLNTYAAKKALPGLVIGVVGANASLLLIRFVLDVAKALQLFAFDIAGVATTGEFVGAFMTKIGMTAFENAIVNGVLITLGPITLIVILIFAIYMFYLVFVFAWGMIKRLVYIYGLTVLAPLAFVSYGIPGQQQWFTKWWDMMLRQVFMLPIVFLGAAMLIKYINITVAPENITGALDISSMINILLVFLTATAILKLPGVITRGAVDITGAAKKAFGMAKVAPQNVLGFSAGMMKSRSGWNTKRMGASQKRIDDLKAAGRHSEAAREARKFEGYKRRSEAWDKMGKKKGLLGIDTWRKYATAAGNPEIFYAGYQDRMKQAATDRKVEFNSTKAEDVPLVPLNWAAQKLGLYSGGTGIRGIASGRKSEVNAGIDDVNDYIARGGDIKKLIEDVMLKKDGSGDREVWTALKDGISTGTIKDKDILSLAGRANKGSLQSAVLDMVNNNGLAGHDSAWRSHGVMREIYEAVNKEVLNRTRNTDLSLEEKNQMTLDYVKEAVRSNGNFEVTIKPDTIIPTEGPNKGFSPRAVANATAAAGGGGGATAPFGIQDVRIVDLSPEAEAVASQLHQNAQNILSKHTVDDVTAHVSKATNAAELFSGPIGETLSHEFASFMGAGGDAIVKKVVGAVANGGDINSVRKMLATGQAIEQTHNDFAAQTAEISDEQLDRLGDKIKSSTNDAIKDVGTLIAPHLDKLGFDSAAQAQLAQKIVEGYRQVTTVGPKSLRGHLQSSLVNLVDEFAKNQNVNHITPSSVISAIAQAEAKKPTAPTTSAPNITTINKVEQPAPVKSSTPSVSSVQEEGSSSPTGAEPSADK